MKNPVKTIPIADGNLLKIYDISKNIAEDLWLLKILFRAEIRIEEEMFNKEDLQKFKVPELMEVLGNSVLFEAIRERNFIHEKDRDKQFQSLVDDYVNTNGSYLQSPGFSRKFVLQQFMESQKRSIPWTR